MPANRQSTKNHNTYQLYIYSIPPDDGLPICLKYIEVDWRNKLRIKNASGWFSFHGYIEMYGQQSIKIETECLLRGADWIFYPLRIKRVLWRTYNWQLCCCVLHRGAQVFEKSRSYLKPVGATSITWSKSHTRRPTNIRRHCTNFSRPGFSARNLFFTGIACF